jgi:hypothetical protein
MHEGQRPDEQGEGEEVLHGDRIVVPGPAEPVG